MPMLTCREWAFAYATVMIAEIRFLVHVFCYIQLEFFCFTILFDRKAVTRRTEFSNQ